MKYWRSLLLIGLGGAAWLTLGRVMLGAGSDRPIQLPASVPLTGWQLTGTQISATPKANQPNARLAQGNYLYRSAEGAQPLTVQVSYLINTAGDIQSLIKQYPLQPTAPAQPAIIIWKQFEQGEYGLFVVQQQAYLSSCINPRGGTTVTAQQFSRNRNTYDLTISRLWPWLLGQTDLREWRCLWLTLSVPVENSDNPETAYQQLETVWKSLYPAWQTQFGQL